MATDQPVRLVVQEFSHLGGGESGDRSTAWLSCLTPSRCAAKANPLATRAGLARQSPVTRRGAAQPGPGGSGRASRTLTVTAADAVSPSSSVTVHPNLHRAELRERRSGHRHPIRCVKAPRRRAPRVRHRAAVRVARRRVSVTAPPRDTVAASAVRHAPAASVPSGPAGEPLLSPTVLPGVSRATSGWRSPRREWPRFGRASHPRTPCQTSFEGSEIRLGL